MFIEDHVFAYMPTNDWQNDKDMPVVNFKPTNSILIYRFK